MQRFSLLVDNMESSLMPEPRGSTGFFQKTSCLCKRDLHKEPDAFGRSNVCQHL